MTIVLRSQLSRNLTAAEADGDITDLDGRITALTAVVGGKVDSATFVEQSQDVVGAMVTAAGGTYDDTGGTITFPASGAAITIQDEGTPLTTAATVINFTGAGVAASGAGSTKTITISGATISSTDALTEGTTNLYATPARTRAVVLTGLSLADATDGAATDTILAFLGKMQAKWVAFAASVRAVVLTGIDIATVGAVSAADTVMAAIGKLEATKAPKASPTLTGLVTTNGSNVTTANAMVALSIDTAKGLNTKTIAADSTVTFSGNPATADTWFSLFLINSDTNPHTLTFPSAFSQVTQAARTTCPIAASGQLYLLFRWDGAAYKVFGDSPYLNNYAATTAPVVGSDVTLGYGPGSLWLNTTTGTLYVCQSNGTGAAVWDAAGSGISYATTVTAAATTTLTVSSAKDQFFTGTTTQIVALPVASTLTLGQSYRIRNKSTGIVTVNSSGGNLVATIAPNGTAAITCILISGTTAASWDLSLNQLAYPAFTLTDAATIAVDASKCHGVVTLGGNRILGAPTNIIDGQPYVLYVKQDATGSRTLDLTTSGLYMCAAGIASIVLSTAANAVDLITMTYSSVTGKFWVTIQKAGS